MIFMRVSIIGTGYVGTVSAACFAELGFQVVCVDVVPEKIDMINSGRAPIYEEGLEELLLKHAGRTLRATMDYHDAICSTDITFICVGTPSDETGNIDLSIVRAASKSIGEALADKQDYHVVVVKSTVVPETTEKLVLPILEKYSGKEAGKNFGVAMNPEFLREGKAVHDFMHPDKIVVGAIDKRSGDAVAELYRDLKCEVMRTNPRTAEMIKYVNNAFLATKISFSNEVGNICKLLGVDTYEVMEAVGRDFRISPYFLNSGAGFGGSCFPKDVQALIHKAREIGYKPVLLESVLGINEQQPLRMLALLRERLEDLRDRRIAVLGLAFKNDTDDIRESRAIPVIRELIKEGAIVSAYDPMAVGEMKKLFPEVIYARSAEDALRDADACLVMTEWEEFKKLKDEFKVMRQPVVIDGRRVISSAAKEHIDYTGICW